MIGHFGFVDWIEVFALIGLVEVQVGLVLGGRISWIDLDTLDSLIGLDPLLGLDWFLGLDWIGLDRIGLDWLNWMASLD